MQFKIMSLLLDATSLHPDLVDDEKFNQRILKFNVNGGKMLQVLLFCNFQVRSFLYICVFLFIWLQRGPAGFSILDIIAVTFLYMLLPLLLGLGGAGLRSTGRHLPTETALSENIDLPQIVRALYTQPLASSPFDLGRSVKTTKIEQDSELLHKWVFSNSFFSFWEFYNQTPDWQPAEFRAVNERRRIPSGAGERSIPGIIPPRLSREWRHSYPTQLVFPKHLLYFFSFRL